MAKVQPVDPAMVAAHRGLAGRPAAERRRLEGRPVRVLLVPDQHRAQHRVRGVGAGAAATRARAAERARLREGEPRQRATTATRSASSPTPSPRPRRPTRPLTHRARQARAAEAGRRREDLWDSDGTQTNFYGGGNDAAVTTTALVAHAMLQPAAAERPGHGALDYLTAPRTRNGNFGSTQATVWTLRTLLLAARRAPRARSAALDVDVDGNPFTTLALTQTNPT